MKFLKYHGLGNDYIVLDPAEVGDDLSRDRIRLICHRNYGPGSDGILLGPLPAEGGRRAVRIFNPDGSEAEKSGNGLRIFCRYLHDRGLVGAEPFEVDTLGGRVRCRVERSGDAVTVQMGCVSFNSADIPVQGPPREVLQEEIKAAGRIFTFSAATVGNPHCVITGEKPTRDLACTFGPSIETDPRFPKRTNVQFMEVLARDCIRIEIWERGAGYTLASGSSSSAAAAVARKLGLCDDRIAVCMPGGVLDIVIADDYSVTMSGPVTKVCHGLIADEAFSTTLPD